MLDACQVTKDPLPSKASGVVLVLHGGTDNPKKAALPARQTWPTAFGQTQRIREGVRKRVTGRGISVWMLRHRLAGWDDNSNPTPVTEVRHTLDLVRSDHGDVPVVLVGHSMGGRTAVRAADDDSVVGVVGLAPWLPAEESPETLAGKSLSVAHAKLDHLCALKTMQDFLKRARNTASEVVVEDMGWDTHYLVYERPWHDFAAAQTLRRMA